MPKKSNFQAVFALLIPQNAFDFDMEQSTKLVDTLFEEGSDEAALDRKKRKTMGLVVKQYTIFYYFKPKYFRMQLERIPVPESHPLYNAYPHIVTLAADLELDNFGQVEKFIEVGRKAISFLVPDFAWADNLNNMPEPLGNAGAVDPRRDVWGLTYYSPFSVEEIGRDHFQHAPAALLEELETGAFIMLADANPFCVDLQKKVALQAWLRE